MDYAIVIFYVAANVFFTLVVPSLNKRLVRRVLAVNSRAGARSARGKYTARSSENNRPERPVSMRAADEHWLGQAVICEPLIGRPAGNYSRQRSENGG